MLLGEAGADLYPMAQDFVVEWNDVEIDPVGEDVFVSTSRRHRNQIFLVLIAPDVRLATLQEGVPTSLACQPISQDLQICLVGLFEHAGVAEPMQGFVFGDELPSADLLDGAASVSFQALYILYSFSNCRISSTLRHCTSPSSQS